MDKAKALRILEDVMNIYCDSSQEGARTEAREAQEYIERNLGNTHTYQCDNETCESLKPISWDIEAYAESGSPICPYCGDDMTRINE